MGLPGLFGYVLMRKRKRRVEEKGIWGVQIRGVEFLSSCSLRTLPTWMSGADLGHLRTGVWAR